MNVQFTIGSDDKGHTLTTLEYIKQGQLIWKYDEKSVRELGVKILTLKEIHDLPSDERDTFEKYCWQVGTNEWEGVTKNPENDPMNFVDHSCDPNMHFIDDDTLVAKRDIKKFERLTLEYATCDTIYADIPVCLCGAKNCRGTVKATDAYDTNIIKGCYQRRGVSRTRDPPSTPFIS